jgi:hypothetical protein
LPRNGGFARATFSTEGEKTNERDILIPMKKREARRTMGRGKHNWFSRFPAKKTNIQETTHTNPEKHGVEGME